MLPLAILCAPLTLLLAAVAPLFDWRNSLAEANAAPLVDTQPDSRRGER